MNDLTDETLAEQETAARNRLSSGDWSVMADANFTLVLIDEVRTLRTKVEAAEALADELAEEIRCLRAGGTG